MTYPDQFEFYDELIQTVHDLQGKITHEYTLFNGFSLDLPDNTITVLKDINDKLLWGLTIEEDQQVHAYANEHIL